MSVYGRDPSGKLASYTGQLLIAAIPEPENYAMFLAGLGLLGVFARRRRNT